MKRKLPVLALTAVASLALPGNILFKNTFIVSIGILTYALCGFNLMYPGEFNGFLGFAGSGLGAGYAEGANTVAYADGGYTYWTDFLFQAMFAATAATIVSGAVAERIKLSSFMIFSTIFVASSTRSPAPGSGAAAGSTPWASTTSPARRWCTRSAAGAR